MNSPFAPSTQAEADDPRAREDGGHSRQVVRRRPLRQGAPLVADQRWRLRTVSPLLHCPEVLNDQSLIIWQFSS